MKRTYCDRCGVTIWPNEVHHAVDVGVLITGIGVFSRHEDWCNNCMVCSCFAAEIYRSPKHDKSDDVIEALERICEQMRGEIQEEAN